MIVNKNLLTAASKQRVAATRAKAGPKRVAKKRTGLGKRTPQKSAMAGSVIRNTVAKSKAARVAKNPNARVASKPAAAMAGRKRMSSGLKKIR